MSGQFEQSSYLCHTIIIIMVIMLQSYTHTDTLLPVQDGGWQLLEDGGHEEAGGGLSAPACSDTLSPGGRGLRGQTHNLDNILYF